MFDQYIDISKITGESKKYFIYLIKKVSFYAKNIIALKYYSEF